MNDGELWRPFLWRVCHGGGRGLRRGVLGLGDRDFPGGLGGGHGREMGFQRRQYLIIRPMFYCCTWRHFGGCFGMTT
jgi:hypothetical protein